MRVAQPTSPCAIGVEIQSAHFCHSRRGEVNTMGSGGIRSWVIGGGLDWVLGAGMHTPGARAWLGRRHHQGLKHTKWKIPLKIVWATTAAVAMALMISHHTTIPTTAAAAIPPQHHNTAARRAGEGSHLLSVAKKQSNTGADEYDIHHHRNGTIRVPVWPSCFIARGNAPEWVEFPILYHNLST